MAACVVSGVNCCNYTSWNSAILAATQQQSVLAPLKQLVLWGKMDSNKKNGRKQTPIKIQFYLLGGGFSPVYSLYRA